MWKAADLEWVGQERRLQIMCPKQLDNIFLESLSLLYQDFLNLLLEGILMLIAKYYFSIYTDYSSSSLHVGKGKVDVKSPIGVLKRDISKIDRWEI